MIRHSTISNHAAKFMLESEAKSEAIDAKNYGEKQALRPTRMMGHLLKNLQFHSFCTEYFVYREGSICIFFLMAMASMTCLGSAGFLHRTW